MKKDLKCASLWAKMQLKNKQKSPKEHVSGEARIP
jgi:hypothetical protein